VTATSGALARTLADGPGGSRSGSSSHRRHLPARNDSPLAGLRPVAIAACAAGCRITPFFGSPTKAVRIHGARTARFVRQSAGPDPGEVLQDGGDGPARDAGRTRKSSYDAIREVLDSEAQGRALGHAARRDAESNHTWEDRARFRPRAPGQGPVVTLSAISAAAQPVAAGREEVPCQDR